MFPKSCIYDLNLNYNKINLEYSLTAIQISTFGVLLFRGKELKGKELIQTAQKLDPYDTNVILNSAFTLLIESDYNKCISMFSYVISTNLNLSYAFANRGLAKILDNNVSNGLTDINKALEINVIEPYAHRSKGIYYFNSGNYKKALEHFRIAFKYGKDTYEVEEYIDSCLKKILEN